MPLLSAICFLIAMRPALSSPSERSGEMSVKRLSASSSCHFCTVSVVFIIVVPPFEAAIQHSVLTVNEKWVHYIHPATGTSLPPLL